MSELIPSYFTADWRTRSLACPCGWEGDSRAMAMELHDQVTDYACPQCGNLLMIVPHPSLDDVRQAAAEGHPEAIEQLAIIQDALQRFPAGHDPAP
jgi:DNA-directed RNA polymerase subunit RPC12/RpoP